MRRTCPARFFLKPVINRKPLAWGGKVVVRDTHYIAIWVDGATVIERPATFKDALEYPLQMTLYRRRLNGSRGGKRGKRRHV